MAGGFLRLQLQFAVLKYTTESDHEHECYIDDTLKIIVNKNKNIYLLHRVAACPFYCHEVCQNSL